MKKQDQHQLQQLVCSNGYNRLENISIFLKKLSLAEMHLCLLKNNLNRKKNNYKKKLKK